MSPLLSIVTVLLTFLFPLFSHAKIISKTNYGYPILDPDEATIASTAIHTEPSNSEFIKVRVKDRQIRGYGDERDLVTRFYPSTAPTNHLVFIISGLGGDCKSNFSTFFAAQAQLRGADAVIVPNSIMPNFIISSSTSGLVGESAADAADLYRALTLVKQQLQEKGRNYSRVSLLGYSHGALIAAFLQAADQQALQLQRVDALRFDTTLLINPPIDLLHAIRTIDERTKATKQIGFKSLVEIVIRFRKMLSRFSQLVTTSETHVEFSQSLKLQADERFALIGKALTISLPSSILASQAVDDLGILPEVDDQDSVNYRYSIQEREGAAGSYDFEGYVTTFFRARAEKTKSPFSLEYLNQINSLTALTEMLRSSKNIYLMHNMDDLLLTNGQGYWLDQLFGKRAIIFPTGGHLGNIWYPDNLNAFATWLYYGRW